MDSTERKMRVHIDALDDWLMDVMDNAVVYHDDHIIRNSLIRQRHRAIQELQQRQLERMLELAAS